MRHQADKRQRMRHVETTSEVADLGVKIMCLQQPMQMSKHWFSCSHIGGGSVIISHTQ